MACCCIGKLKGCTCVGRCNCECTCQEPKTPVAPRFIQIGQSREDLINTFGLEMVETMEACPIDIVDTSDLGLRLREGYVNWSDPLEMVPINYYPLLPKPPPKVDGVCTCCGRIEGCTCGGDYGKPDPAVLTLEDLDRTIKLIRENEDLLEGPVHEYWCPISMNDAGCEDECSCRDIPDVSYLFNDVQEGGDHVYGV